MEKVFQRYDLNLEAIIESGNKATSKLNIEAKKTLIQGLLSKGYVVLPSSELLKGVPKSILVGGELPGKNHKSDFYEIAGKLGLLYESKEFYIQRDETD